MITNILATLIVMVTTNVYAPKQYQATLYLTTYPAQVEESWLDCPSWVPNGFQSQKIRDSPDVQIVEVHEIRKWHFDLEGVPDHIISDELLKKTERRRTVKTIETWTEKEIELPIDWINFTTNTVMASGLHCFSNSAGTRKAAP